MNDLWTIEKEVTDIFLQTVDTVGFWLADQAFDEAGLFDTVIEPDKIERATEVAQRLGVDLGGNDER